MLALIAAPLVVQAAAGFVPPLDRPIAYSFTDVRESKGRTLRFEVRRRVTFRRTDGDLSAEVETIDVAGAADGAGDMFSAMMRGWIGRRILFRLAPDGRVVDVDDLDAQWTAYVDGIAGFATANAGSPRGAMAAKVAAVQRLLSRPHRIATLAEMLSPLIAGPPPPPAQQHPVTVPGRAHDGSSTTLAGTERITAGADGLLHVDRAAEGLVAGTTTSLSLRRRIDPATGLALETIERLTTSTPDTQAIVTRTTTVLPQVL